MLLRLFLNFFFNLTANIIYPRITSSTCCHGLVDSGFLILTFSFFDQDLIQSVIILFGDQSPPPITFPALAVQIKTLLLFEEKRFIIRIYSNVRRRF